MTLWGGRFSSATADAMAALSRSVHFDWRLAPYDIVSSKAHCRNLVKSRILSAAEGKKIETIESLEKNGQLSKIQKAWVDNQVPQCGYCQSGMVMATTALLRNHPKPTDAQIDESITNICRCGTFQQVRGAIHAASKA